MAYFQPINSIVDIPADQLPDEDFLQREPMLPPPEPAPHSAQPEAPLQDDAADKLKAHIESAKRAEAIQQHRQAMAAAEQRRVDWVKSNAMAQAHYGELGALHHAALQAGLSDTSDAYFKFLESGLEALAQEQPAAETMEASMPVERPQPMAVEPPPEFFGPKPVAMPAPRSVMVSAPVSRTIPSAGDRDRLSNDPRHIRLSPAQREAAKIAGVDELTYARQLVRMERAKRDGWIQS